MTKCLFIFLFISGNLINAQSINLENEDYYRSDSVAGYYKGESLQDLPSLTHKLTDSLITQIEKFRAIYTWVCINIESDFWAFEKNKRRRNQFKNDSIALANWNKDFGKTALNNLFLENKTVCTGYAFLLKEMSAIIGVDCKIIDGYGRHATMNIREASVPNHSWNAVFLNNKWHLCDATWSSGSFDTDKNRFIPDYNDGYFLAPPQLFVKSHYPLDSNWLLMENAPTFSGFLNGPVIYKETYNHRIIPLEPTIMDINVIKGEYLTFLFNVPDDFRLEEIKVELVIGNWKQVVKSELLIMTDNKLQLNYMFEYLGQFDVHIIYKNDTVATYAVVSKKRKRIKN